MATSIEHDMVAAVENEINCPICWEEFEEPKCLPNCAHNVCQRCLEGMVKKRSDVIVCPVCRVDSIVPTGGVAAFPKNYLLVRLIERTPGRKEKRIFKEAVKNVKKGIEAAETAIKDMEDSLETSKSKDEETKHRIKSLADVVVTKVREQEQELLLQMKTRQNHNEKAFQNLKSNVMVLCGTASDCIQTVDDLLANGKLEDLKSVDVEHFNDVSKALEMCISRENCEFTKLLRVALTNTGSVEKFIKDGCFLGKLTINNGTASVNQDMAASASSIPVSTATTSPREDMAASDSLMPVSSTSTISPRSIGYSTCGSVVQTIDSSSTGGGELIPFSVAVSRISGHLVVLDEESNMIHIFNEEGEHLHKFRIKFGDLWDIAVSNDNEIVVVNRDNNRLLHYDMNGNFLKKFVTAPQEKVKFSSLSFDVHGRFIISSSPFNSCNETLDDVTPCILVYSPSGNQTLAFGEKNLLSPQKAVFLNGKFFVTDYGLKKVLVYDKTGTFLRRFGGSQLECPVGIAADHRKGYLVVCDSENNTIHIYSHTGHSLHHFQTAHSPKQVAFTKNYEHLLISCDTDDDNSYIQKVTYF